MQEMIDVGYVVTNNKQVSHYVIVEPKNVDDLLKQMSPFLRIKSEQATIMMRIIERLPATKMDHLK